MEKKHFFIKLIPPRPNFAKEMSEAEKELMQQHVLYWQDLMRRKIAVIYGPVFDPKGGYGVGIIEVSGEDMARALMAKDPTLQPGQHFSYEIHPMRAIRK